MTTQCYLDESEWQHTGTYLVGVLAIEEHTHDTFVESMSEALAFARSITGFPGAEIHGQEIFQGSGPYCNVLPQDRVDLFRLVMRIVSTTTYRFCVKPINYTEPLYASDPQHILALAWACEHIEIVARDDWHLTADFHPQLNYRVRRAIAQARRGSVRNCRRFLKLTPTSPSILHSHECLGLQACDTALYCVGRYLRDQTISATGRSAREIRKLYSDLSSSGRLLVKNSWP